MFEKFEFLRDGWSVAYDEWTDPVKHVGRYVNQNDTLHRLESVEQKSPSPEPSKSERDGGIIWLESVSGDIMNHGKSTTQGRECMSYKCICCHVFYHDI